MKGEREDDGKVARWEGGREMKGRKVGTKEGGRVRAREEVRKA